MIDFETTLHSVEKIIKDAGKILSLHFGKIIKEDIEVKSKNDYVTFVDKESENFIVTQLKKIFPEASILAEEGEHKSTADGYRWVIDPLDGTKNYIHGYPLFCISISLEKQGRPVLAVIYDPLHDELFEAVIGKGAFLNGEKIGVSSARRLENSMIVTGFPYRAHKMIDEYLRVFKNIFMNTSGMRRDGSAALNLCYVAAGRYDGFWEFKLGRWDISAGSLIVEEAGGKVSGIYGNKDYLDTGNIVAANPFIHNQILEHLADFKLQV